MIQRASQFLLGLGCWVKTPLNSPLGRLWTLSVSTPARRRPLSPADTRPKESRDSTSEHCKAETGELGLLLQLLLPRSGFPVSALEPSRKTAAGMDVLFDGCRPRWERPKRLPSLLPCPVRQTHLVQKIVLHTSKTQDALSFGGDLQMSARNPPTHERFSRYTILGCDWHEEDSLSQDHKPSEAVFLPVADRGLPPAAPSAAKTDLRVSFLSLATGLEMAQNEPWQSQDAQSSWSDNVSFTAVPVSWPRHLGRWLMMLDSV